MQTFRLSFIEPPVLRSATATVVLSEYSIDSEQRVCLTHVCRNSEEVRAEVERLKAELDAVAQQAARRFR